MEARGLPVARPDLRFGDPNLIRTRLEAQVLVVGSLFRGGSSFEGSAPICASGYRKSIKNQVKSPKGFLICAPISGKEPVHLKTSDYIDL